MVRASVVVRRLYAVELMNTSNLVYKKISEQELSFVAELERACFSTPWTEEQYKAVMSQGGCVLFGAWLGEELAGYIAVAVQPVVGEMEVYNIAVALSLRHQGVGKRLLKLALEAAAKNGLARALLEVRVSNAPALSLYRSLGFLEVGRRKNYYQDTGEDALILARSLK